MWLCANKTLFTKWVASQISHREFDSKPGLRKNVLFHLDERGGLGENGCKNMHGYVPLLFTGNYRNIVNQLYPNIK